MLINISELISTPLKKAEYKVSVELDTFDLNGNSYSFKEKDDFEMVVSNVGYKRIHMDGHWHGVIIAPCDRCLKDVSIPIEFSIDEDLDFSSEIQEDSDVDSYITDHSIDVDALIYHEILIRFPMKILCRDDCKGICLKCGNDLNLGECGCDRTSLDPRMAAIQDIFKNFKEV